MSGSQHGGIAPHVSAVTPLRESLDGAPRPVHRARRRARPVDPAPVAGTWACPACGRRTADARDQAIHVARELHRATVMLSELQLAETDLADAIEMSVPEVRSVSYQQLALTEDDCRRAHSAFAVLRKRRQAIPEPIRLGHNEYMRRKQATYRAKWAAARSSTTPDTP